MISAKGLPRSALLAVSFYGGLGTMAFEMVLENLVVEVHDQFADVHRLALGLLAQLLHLERVAATLQHLAGLQALLAGLSADALGLSGAMWLVAALTIVSGLVVALRMSETHRPNQERSEAPWPLPAR